MKTFTKIFAGVVISTVIGLSIFTLTNSNNNNAFAQQDGFNEELNN
jgi:hypothetical protein